MAHGGGGQPVSLGKVMRRAFRAATGLKKKPKIRKKPEDNPAASAADSMGGVSMERVSSFSAEAATAAAARKESVVRVVLKGGVVEVYPGVVLACTVIRNHPPGLCLAHPDVFRNPHGAVVRPLEPLFPGQKFLLLPESTVVRLKQRIPEGSVGSFDAPSDEEEEDDDDDCSDDVVAAASSEEEVDGADDSVFVAGCSAREFYVANDRWAHCQFKKLVHHGLAVEQQQQSPPPPAKKKKKMKKKGNKRKTRKKRRDGRRIAAAQAPGFGRAFAAPMRTWEPSLPSVEEEKDEACCSFSADVPHPPTTLTSAVATTPEIMLEQ